MRSQIAQRTWPSLQRGAGENADKREGQTRNDCTRRVLRVRCVSQPNAAAESGEVKPTTDDRLQMDVFSVQLETGKAALLHLVDVATDSRRQKAVGR